MTKLQKILLIIGFVIITIIIGYVLYLVFFRPLTTGPAADENVNAGLPGVNGAIPTGAEVSGRLPGEGAAVATAKPQVEAPKTSSPVAAGGLTQVAALTQFQVFQPTVSADGSYLIYYDPTAQKFYKITADGQSSLLTDKSFYQVQNITWSPNKNKAIIEYPDGANIMYDFATNKQVTLPKHWQEFSFSPNSSQLVAKSIGLDPENRFLVVAEPDGSKARIIANLGDNVDKVIVTWSPNEQMVALINDDLDLDRKEIYFVGLNNENFKSMVVEGWGFDGRWSPQGDKILYSVYSAATDEKPRLWVSDATATTVGRNRTDLQLNTWASKCAFYGNTTAYCAVPESLEAGAGMFPEEMDNAADLLYKINLTSGTRSLVAQLEGSHTMENLAVSPDGKYLFFIDKFDGRLYEVRLK